MVRTYPCHFFLTRLQPAVVKCWCSPHLSWYSAKYSPFCPRPRALGWVWERTTPLTPRPETARQSGVPKKDSRSSVQCPLLCFKYVYIWFVYMCLYLFICGYIFVYIWYIYIVIPVDIVCGIISLPLKSSEPLPENQLNLNIAFFGRGIDLSQQRQLNSPRVNLSTCCEHISVSDQELIASKSPSSEQDVQNN